MSGPGGNASPAASGPWLLRGVRVLQASATLRARYCGRILADLGADVRVLGGEPVDIRAEDDRRFLLFLESGKQQLGFGLGDDAVVEALRAADVLIDGYDVGSAGRAALDARVDEAASGALVRVALTPFGLTGPASRWHAADLNAFHFSATGARYAGSPYREPLTIGAEQSELWAGLHGAFAALACLNERRSSGLGQLADVTGTESLALLFVSYALVTDYWQQIERGEGLDANFDRPDMSDRSRHYTCQDGRRVHLSAQTKAQFERLLNAMDAPDWLRALSGSAYEREPYADVVNMEVGKWTATLPRPEVIATCIAQNIPCAPENHVSDFESDPQFVAREFLHAIPDPEGGSFRVPSPPFRVDGVRPITAPPPRSDAAGWLHGPGSAAPSSSPEPRLPFAGVRVLELGWVWAGSLPGQMLADLGADVIRVESRLQKDIVRVTPPLFHGEIGRSTYGLNVHRNQRCIALNLATEEGPELVRKLAEQCDIVIENYRVGFVDRRGIGPEELRAINPRIVYVRLSAMGEDGPLVHMPGYGVTIQSMGGLDSVQGYDLAHPVPVSQSFADPMAGTYGGILAAAGWLRAQATGEGATITVAQHETISYLLASPYLRWAVSGDPIYEPGSRHRWHAPHNLYPCPGKDCWIAIAVRSESEWQEFARTLAPELLGDARFATESLRKQHEEALDEAIAAHTRDQDRDALVERLQGAGVAATPVLTCEELFLHPHYWARDDWAEVPDPLGRQVIYGVPWKLSRTPGAVRTPAPPIGAHDDEIYLGLMKLDPAVYEDYKSRQVIW